MLTYYISVNVNNAARSAESTVISKHESVTKIMYDLKQTTFYTSNGVLALMIITTANNDLIIIHHLVILLCFHCV